MLAHHRKAEILSSGKAQVVHSALDLLRQLVPIDAIVSNPILLQVCSTAMPHEPKGVSDKNEECQPGDEQLKRSLRGTKFLTLSSLSSLSSL